MADIYGRVKQIEKRLNFIMANLRMKGAIGNGLLKADGTPDVKIIEGSLEEFFQMLRHADEVITEDQIDPALIGETSNG